MMAKKAARITTSAQLRGFLCDALAKYLVMSFSQRIVVISVNGKNWKPDGIVWVFVVHPSIGSLEILRLITQNLTPV